MINGFKNVKAYVADKGFINTSITIENGLIKAFECPHVGAITLDEGYMVVPGFIDKHMHGKNKSDCMYPKKEDLINISVTKAIEGVTSFLATTMTETPRAIIEALENIRDVQKDERLGAEILGVHLEGPFISKIRKGAQKESCIVPCSVKTFKKYEAVAPNLIKQVTLAVEENGEELIEYLVSKGIVASIGHSNATSEEAFEAIRLGVTSATHTFNAMSPLFHREIGVVGAVLLSPEVSCEFIGDLVHISPNAIKILYHNKGLDKMVLITDSIEASGLSDGIFKLGGQKVIVKNGEAHMEDGVLAGSTARMNDEIRNVKNVLNITLEEAIDLATKNPAKSLNLSHKGQIKVGMDADFVVIDQDINVIMTIVKGKIVYQR